MRFQLTPTNVLAYSLLGLAAAVSFALPDSLTPQSSQAGAPASESPKMRLAGIVRDFKNGHPDFGVSPSAGNGHYAGNVADTLTSDGRPTFKGVTGGPVKDFTLTTGTVKPQKQFAAMITVLGSAINSGTYDRPVTMRITIGSETIDPFGAYDKAVAGNVNKSGNPRKYVHSTVYAANTAIQVTGKSWEKKSDSYSGSSESHWQSHHSYSTTSSSPFIKVLRNGSNVPNLTGFMGQLAVKQFVNEFVNPLTQKMVMKENQVIYLFELGVTDLALPAADFQDLVVLVTLGDPPSYLQSLDAKGNVTSATPVAGGYKVASQWKDSKGNPIAPHLFNSATDSAGSKGAASSGGISSIASFDQWFGDVMGTNLSDSHTITLTRNSSGVWEYLTDSFHPIDDKLLANEGDAHNNYFTYSFSADFTHDAGAGYFFEFEGDDDAWLFVDGKLAMDLGGVIPGTRQYVNFDRLGLTDDQKHTIKFFYAQRQTNLGRFHLRTNLPLEGQYDVASVTASFD